MKQPRIIAFTSSPRARANTDIMADEILKGAAETGAATEKIRLHGLRIQPCRACDACQKTIASPCVIKDDMGPLADKLRAADAYVFAAPIYFCAVNAQMKLFLDRWYSIFGEGTADTLRGRHMALAFAYSDKDPFTSGMMNALRMFQDAGRALGINLAGWVQASCPQAGAVQNDKPVLEAARRLGADLAKAAKASRAK